MTPLFACFPICLTFVAIAIVGVIAVLAVGVNREGPNAPVEGEAAPETTSEPGYGPPRWWVIVLIFAVIFLHFALLLWLWPEL